MGRQIKLTKEQYNKHIQLTEDITVTADVTSAGGDVKKAIDNAKREAQRNGVNLNNLKVVVDANENASKDGSVITETKVFTINDLFR